MLDANVCVSVSVRVCDGRCRVNNVVDGLLRCSTARGQQSRAGQGRAGQSKTRGRKSRRRLRQRCAGGDSLPACLPTNLSMRPPSHHSTAGQPLQPALRRLLLLSRALFIVRHASHDDHSSCHLITHFLLAARNTSLNTLHSRCHAGLATRHTRCHARLASRHTRFHARLASRHNISGRLATALRRRNRLPRQSHHALDKPRSTVQSSGVTHSHSLLVAWQRETPAGSPRENANPNPNHPSPQ